MRSRRSRRRGCNPRAPPARPWCAPGGPNTYFAPSNPGRSRSSAVRVRYCGQVSRPDLQPRACARAISSADSAPETWNIWIGTSSASAIAMMRLHRLALHNHRLAPGVILGRGQAGLPPAARSIHDQKLVVFGMNADQRAVPARRGEHAEDLGIVEPHAVISHEDLDRAVACGDQRGQLFIDHRRRRIGDRSDGRRSPSATSLALR